MHEASIAMAVVEQAVAAARQHGGGRITEIQLDVGMLKQVVPEALDLAFAACAAGTPAEGAALKVTMIAPLAACRACGERFEPDLEHFSFACPKCGQADVEVVEGNEILLRSLSCEEKVSG